MKRHEVDVASLVLGLFFLGVAGIWGLSDVPQHPRHGWWFPLLLIAVGLVGLVASLAGRRATRAASAPADTGPHDRADQGPDGPGEPGDN